MRQCWRSCLEFSGRKLCTWGCVSSFVTITLWAKVTRGSAKMRPCWSCTNMKLLGLPPKEVVPISQEELQSSVVSLQRCPLLLKSVVSPQGCPLKWGWWWTSLQTCFPLPPSPAASHSCSGFLPLLTLHGLAFRGAFVVAPVR